VTEKDLKLATLGEPRRNMKRWEGDRSKKKKKKKKKPNQKKTKGYEKKKPKKKRHRGMFSARGEKGVQEGG